LSEAKSPSGTWTLATHSRITDSLSQSPDSDIEFFMSAIIKRIISPESAEGERFKLAQLCTMARQKQFSHINQVFIRYKNDLINTATNGQTSPLGVAIAQLIQSLFTDPHHGHPRCQNFRHRSGRSVKYTQVANHVA
jgi:hypothetical protein